MSEPLYSWHIKLDSGPEYAGIPETLDAITAFIKAYFPGQALQLTLKSPENKG